MASATDVDRLIRDHLWLARTLAAQSPVIDKAAAFSAAMGGLQAAAERWDAQTGTFTALATTCIRRRLVDAVRVECGRTHESKCGKKRRDHLCLSLDAEVPGNDKPVTFAEITEDINGSAPDEDAERRGDFERLRRLLGRLPARDRKILCAYWVDGELLETIARRYRVTESRIQQIVSRNLTILRNRWKQGIAA